MSTDTLPARTTTTAAAHTDDTNPAGETLDHAKVHAHRDWRQLASEVVGLAAAFTAAAGVGGIATNTLIEVSKGLAVLAGALVALLVWLLTETAREGRRWVYADTDEPYDGDPTATP